MPLNYPPWLEIEIYSYQMAKNALNYPPFLSILWNIIQQKLAKNRNFHRKLAYFGQKLENEDKKQKSKWTLL